MRAALVLAALLFAADARGQGRGALEGTIYDAATKKPAPGVTVELQGGPSVVTDGNGRFHMDGLRPGGYTLVLRAPSGGSLHQDLEIVADATLRVTVHLDLGLESVTVRERAAPSKRREPEPMERYSRLTPPYSDELIDANDWAVVWLLLHVDARGVVTKVDVLKSPAGYKLDDLARKHVMKFRFKPGLDDAGKPAPYEVVYPLEWVPYWSLILGGPRNPPCKGSGPLNLDSYMPVYRDCDPPPGYDLPKLKQKRWSRFEGLRDTEPAVESPKR